MGEETESGLLLSPVSQRESESESGLLLSPVSQRESESAVNFNNKPFLISMSSNPSNGEVYSIQHYVIKFVSDLQQFAGFSGFIHQ